MNSAATSGVVEAAAYVVGSARGLAPVAARLVALARERGMKVRARAPDAQTARALSAALWGWRGGASFLAHGVEGDAPDDSPDSHPIWIALSDPTPPASPPADGAATTALALSGAPIEPAAGYARLACVLAADDAPARAATMATLEAWRGRRGARARWFVHADGGWRETETTGETS